MCCAPVKFSRKIRIWNSFCSHDSKSHQKNSCKLRNCFFRNFELPCSAARWFRTASEHRTASEVDRKHLQNFPRYLESRAPVRFWCRIRKLAQKYLHTTMHIEICLRVSAGKFGALDGLAKMLCLSFSRSRDWLKMLCLSFSWKSSKSVRSFENLWTSLRQLWLEKEIWTKVTRNWN